MDKLSSDSAPERRVMFHISRFLESNPDYKLTDQEQECLDKNHNISLITKKPRRIPLFTSQLALVSSVAFLATYGLSKYGSQSLAQCFLDCPDKTTEFNKAVRESLKKYNPSHKSYFDQEKK